MQQTIRTDAQKVKRGARYIALSVLIYVGLALLGSAALTLSARKTPYYETDLSITRRLQAFRPAWFDKLMRLVCSVGYPLQANLLGVLLIAAMYTFGLRWETVTTIFATLGSALTALVLVLYVNRPRPSEKLVRVFNHLPTTSFPSGHTLIFTAVCGFLIYLVHRSHLPRLARLPLYSFFGGIVTLMGPARVYSGEHWASDVLAGYLIGSSWLALVVKFYHWGKPRYFKRG